MAGENPPAESIIYYYFEKKPATKVTLEILDNEEKVVRAFTSRSGESAGNARRNRGGIPAKAGMNRFAWDMKYPRVETTKDTLVAGGYTGGPTAVPGTYHVRLTWGEWSRTQSFEVKKDPRLDISIAEYQKQFDLMQDIKGELDRMQAALRRIRSARKERPDDPRSKELTSIEETLMQLKNGFRTDPLNFPPRLMGQMAFLYGQVNGADGTPTAGSYERFEDLKKIMIEPMSRLEELLK